MSERVESTFYVRENGRDVFSTLVEAEDVARVAYFLWEGYASIRETFKEGGVEELYDNLFNVMGDAYLNPNYEVKFYEFGITCVNRMVGGEQND